jgi:hypothetical protein
MIKKVILGFVAGTVFTGSLFQFNIGLPSFNSSNIKKATKAIKSKKIKLKKGVVKRATVRATAIIAETAVPLPLLTAGIAATTVIVITANEHCETQNTLDNITLILEGRSEKEMSISECSDKIFDDTKEALLESGSDINGWMEDTYGGASDWIYNQWNSTFDSEK